MVDIQNRLENERKHGEFLAKSPAEIWGHASKAGKLRTKRRVDIFCEKAGLQPGNRVCEIGCGTGIFTKLLVEKSGANIVGIDISPDLLEIAKTNYSDPRVSYMLGDCMSPESLDVPLDFDAVVTNSVLHHLEIPKALIAINQLLKPGGVFVCSEPNMMNPQIAIQKNIPIIKKWAGDSPDETAFFRWKIGKQLADSGFVDIQVYPFDFLHPKLPDSLAITGDKFLRFIETLPIVKEISGSLIIFGKKPLN